MRCNCCDKNLSDYECSLKSSKTEEYLDTCTKCLNGLGISYVGRYDSDHSSPDEDEYNDDDLENLEDFLHIPKPEMDDE